LFLKHSNCS